MPASAQRRAAKEARREANREAWRNDPRNRNSHNFAVRAEIKPIDPVPVEDVGALDLLREVMLDDALPLGRRLRAASHVLRYEMPLAGAAGMSPDQVSTSSAYRFLVGVVRSGASAEHKQAAAEILAAFENERPQRANPDELVEARLQLIAMINSHRRLALAAAGHWPPPPGTCWALSAADDFETPSCAAAGRQVLPLSIAEMLERARARDPAEAQREADERHRLMLSVEAHNRDDRSWRRLIEG